MILTDGLCDRLCAAAREKSRELGIDISFAISDENGLPRAYRRYGDALVLNITLVPGKAYTSAVTQCRTKDVAACAAEGGSLMAIQANDPKVMYCRMLDAMLSKGQEDENGILFVCFPVTAIAAVLSRSPMTVKRSLNELETAGLIMRVRQGVGEPNRIYVLIPGKEDAALA